jgi:copper homeostasis protein
MSVLLETPVDDATGLAIAVQSGADRIELCASLATGGLTPSTGLMQLAGRAGLPIFAMIRPRAGDFCYSPDEIAVMRADIIAARQAGLQGVVLGALDENDALDLPAMQGLMSAAQGMEVTLHRAFDLIRDWRLAVDQAVDLGIRRILTSGQALTAPEGADLLARIMDHAAGRLIVMPGAGVTAETLPALARLRLSEIHASCGAVQALDDRLRAMGFSSAAPRLPDPARIAALKQALAALTAGDPT